MMMGKDAAKSGNAADPSVAASASAASSAGSPAGSSASPLAASTIPHNTSNVYNNCRIIISTGTTYINGGKRKFAEVVEDIDEEVEEKSVYDGGLDLPEAIDDDELVTADLHQFVPKRRK